MRKKDFIDKVASELGVTKVAARKAVDAIYEELALQLKKDGQFQLQGIGTLKVGKRAARNVRHPQTGKPLAVPETKTVTFKVSKKLKTALDE